MIIAEMIGHVSNVCVCLCRAAMTEAMRNCTVFHHIWLQSV